VADAFQADFMINCISNPINHFWQAEIYFSPAATRLQEGAETVF
jgi:hypothetical protein